MQLSDLKTSLTALDVFQAEQVVTRMRAARRVEIGYAPAKRKASKAAAEKAPRVPRSITPKAAKKQDNTLATLQALAMQLGLTLKPKEQT